MLVRKPTGALLGSISRHVYRLLNLISFRCHGLLPVGALTMPQLLCAQADPGGVTVLAVNII